MKRISIRPPLFFVVAFFMLTMFIGPWGQFVTPVYAEGEKQIDKICFDGDSDYDWAHFYNVEGTEGTKSQDELKITVLDKAGDTVNAEDYDITIEHFFYWDEEAGQDIYEPAESPFGIYDDEKESGFSEYRATVTAKDGVDVTGQAEGTFFIADKYCLNYVIPEIYFENFSSKDGWRMHDRYWFAPGEVGIPVVKDGSGATLTVRNDFEVGFYYRSGSPENMDDPNVGFEDILVADDDHLVKDGEGNPTIPTEPGEYFVKVEGKNPYYGGNKILIDISDTAPIIVSGERELWSDEDLVLDVTPPVGITGDYRFIVGVRGEDDWDVCFADRDNESDYFEYDEENKKLTLHGKAIFDEIGESYLNIYVNAKDQGDVVAEGFADVFVREAKCEYDLPWDRNILPEWDGWIDKKIQAKVWSKEHPDGFDFECDVISLEAYDSPEHENILEIKDEGDGWSYRGLAPGTVKLKMTYKDLEDNDATHMAIVNVSQVVYNVDMWSETGAYQGLPGTSIELQANARKETAEKRDNGQDGEGYHEWWHHEETSEGLQYQ